MKPYHKELIKKFFQTQKPIAIIKPRFNYADFINDVRITMHKTLGLPMYFLNNDCIQTYSESRNNDRKKQERGKCQR